jgi:hypothetical protein
MLFGYAYATEPVTDPPTQDIEWEDAEALIHPCEEEEYDQLGWFDRAHLLLSSGVCGQALWFDSFFGDIEQNEVASSLVRVINELEWHEKRGWDYSPRISASFYLPRMQRKARLIIEGDDGKTNSAASEYGQPRELDNNNNEGGLAAAFRWSLRQVKNSDIDLDTGVRLRSSAIDPFARIRYRYNYALRYDTVAKFSQQFLLRNSDNWSERSELAIDHLRGPVGYRWNNALTYGDETEGFEWEVSLTRAEQLDQKSAYTTYVSFSGATDQPETETERWRIAASYRRSFYRPWYFYQIEPQMNYEREYGWEWNPAIVFSIEVQLGKSRRNKSSYRLRPTAEEQPSTDPEERLQHNIPI